MIPLWGFLLAVLAEVRVSNVPEPPTLNESMLAWLVFAVTIGITTWRIVKAFTTPLRKPLEEVGHRIDEVIGMVKEVKDWNIRADQRFINIEDDLRLERKTSLLHRDRIANDVENIVQKVDKLYGIVHNGPAPNP